ncbi:hypothetical protein [Rhizobium leguminosarum]|uniref:hypothetical protein n=1 Tax=Rhizobium leguminosarum TaxID=384 RepID=UPI0013BFD627|nr:hypothetical protein [Rhizobium leguminosarum]NEH96960.1 hypothetical protein [Rhizobium leguminosarum]NEJ46072.1 hypothetical protein [Rhizobium leguminosarum]NEJ50468.1 hypothetical protein [Rhizobium leguminosarum]
MTNEIRRWMRCRSLMRIAAGWGFDRTCVPQTVILAVVEDDRPIPQCSACFAAAHPKTSANDAVTLLSHLKEIIFSTYKEDRSRITWRSYRVVYAAYCFFPNEKNA